MTRRGVLTTGGLALAGLAVPRLARPAGVVDIHMRSDPRGEAVWFDPIGVLIEPGQSVRWIVAANVHTTTAYHPKNARHSLRIPDGATPWDSGVLVNPDAHFEVTLTVEGVYDYFCLPHEMAGMVGRIIVGRPAGRAPSRSTTSRTARRPPTGCRSPNRLRRPFPPSRRS